MHVLNEEIVYIGIGSNIGNRERNCLSAIEFLCNSRFFKVLRTSSLYHTEPIGFKEQRWFINCVVSGTTDVSPRELLILLKDYEKSQKRERSVKWGPRVIDLDILFYGQRVINEEGLIIPHPEIENRLFVLIPLSEIEPGFEHPVSKKRISDILSNPSLNEKVIPIRNKFLAGPSVCL